MKTFILLILMATIFGCNKEKKDRQAPENKNPVVLGTPEPNPEPNPEPTNTSEEVLYICSFSENINICDINEYAKPRLIQLSQNGIVTSKMLELKEVKEKYDLTETQVKCLKENFCKEEY
jgi:hypothetical protein